MRLLDTGADGFIPAATLGREYFSYDEAAHALTARSGESYRLADMIEVRLVEAAPIAGALRFEVVGGGARSTGVKMAKPREFCGAPKRKPAKARRGR